MVVAKQFNFSVRRMGYSFVCSRAMRTGKKADIDPSQKVRDSKSLKTDCPFKVSFNYTERKLKHELTPEDLQSTGKKRHSDEVKVTSICAMHGPDCELHHGE